ncbi:MAG TPA: hypothetical protein VFR15_20400, partial [Chloroflexia bacterium]|nr:hypothetical protein [Chloroflexia bacterium]
MSATQDATSTTIQAEPVAPPIEHAEEEARQEAHPFDWRRIALQAALVWLAMRVVYAVSTYIAVLFLKQGFDPVQMGLGGPTYPGELFRTWYQWDVGWYLPISNEGYAPDVRRAAFFPLYPLLINLGTSIGGDPTRYPVAMLIANLGALAAFVGVALVAAREKGAAAASYALLAFAAYPFAFFTAAAYPDGLFVGLAAFALLFARQHVWYAAAACAFLAALARPTGIALAIPLIWEFASRHTTWNRDSRLPRLAVTWRDAAKGALVAGAVPLGVGLFALYLWSVFGDPLVFVKIQSYWAHAFVPPWDLPALAWNSIGAQLEWSFNQSRVIIDIAPAVLFLGLTVAAARRLPASFTLYMACVLLVSLASPLVAYFNPFASVGRYLIAAF